LLFVDVIDAANIQVKLSEGCFERAVPLLQVPRIIMTRGG
jgi:hypothetical protein